MHCLVAHKGRGGGAENAPATWVAVFITHKKRKKRKMTEAMRSTRQFIKIGKPHQTSLLYFIGETSVVLLQRKCTLHWFDSFSFLSAGSMSVSDAMIKNPAKEDLHVEFFILRWAICLARGGT